MAKQNVYVVTMQRWGDDESHNYVKGVFTKKAQAQKCGESERAYRGCKYEAKISELVLDEHDQETLDYMQKILGNA